MIIIPIGDVMAYGQICDGSRSKGTGCEQSVMIEAGCRPVPDGSQVCNSEQIMQLRQANGNAIIMTGISSRTMSMAMTVTLCFSLGGCDKQGRERDATAFGKECGLAGFNPKQCTFLYGLRQDGRDRASDSEAMALVGMSAANVAAINVLRH